MTFDLSLNPMSPELFFLLLTIGLIYLAYLQAKVIGYRRQAQERRDAIKKCQPQIFVEVHKAKSGQHRVHFVDAHGKNVAFSPAGVKDAAVCEQAAQRIAGSCLVFRAVHHRGVGNG